QDIPDRLITGIAHMSSIAQIKVQTKEEEAYHVQSEVFKAMAEAGISGDFINISTSGVIYTVPAALVDNAVDILKQLAFRPAATKQCAKVSAVGAGMTGVPGVAAKIIQALTNAGVRILQSADSHTTIWVLIHEDQLKTAVNALHDAFELNKSPQHKTLSI